MPCLVRRHERSLSICSARAMMKRHEYSASTIASASTVLPSAEVIPLPTAKRTRAAPSRRRPCARCTALWDNTSVFSGMLAVAASACALCGRAGGLGFFNTGTSTGEQRRIVLGDVSAVSLEDARDAGSPYSSKRCSRQQSVGLIVKRSAAPERFWRLSRHIYPMQRDAKSHAPTRRQNAICATTWQQFIMTARKQYAGATLPCSWSVSRRGRGLSRQTVYGRPSARCGLGDCEPVTRLRCHRVRKLSPAP
jgi:hypothetical protein